MALLKFGIWREYCRVLYGGKEAAWDWCNKVVVEWEDAGVITTREDARTEISVAIQKFGCRGVG